MHTSSSYAKLLGKQIFSLGRFPEVGQKQRMDKREKERPKYGEERKRKTESLFFRMAFIFYTIDEIERLLIFRRKFHYKRVWNILVDTLSLVQKLAYILYNWDVDLFIVALSSKLQYYIKFEKIYPLCKNPEI